MPIFHKNPNILCFFFFVSKPLEFANKFEINISRRHSYQLVFNNISFIIFMQSVEINLIFFYIFCCILCYKLVLLNTILFRVFILFYFLFYFIFCKFKSENLNGF